MTKELDQQDGVGPESPDTPYVGLVPYGEDDSAFFFGRDAEERIVGGNLRASGLTLLYGASGVGKTSLLRAGVVHDLRLQMSAARPADADRVPFAVCSFSDWRDDPLPALMETIRVAAVDALGGADLPPWSPGDSVDGTLRSWTERVRTLLVILDQFEDYFLYHQEEDSEGTFAGEFPAIVNDPNLRVHFLVSIREDALAKLDRFKGRIPRLFANYVRVEHLDRAAARQAIEGPVQEWNRRAPDEPPHSLEPGLVEAVIDAAATGELALVRNETEANSAAADGERVEAPFLQLVMERLWRETVAAGARDLTLGRLEALGGPQRIVENHLLDALRALTPDEREVAADLFRFLVTRAKTKIAHPASDLAEWTGRSEPQVKAALDKLCRGESGRILRRVPPPPTGGETRYELFHDVLAEPILEWRREYEQDRRRRAALRRFALIGGGLLTLVAVFASLGVWALVQRSEAQSATKAATSVALASAAQAQLPDHVEKSLLLGLEAYRASPSAEATSAVVGALEAARRSGAETILRGDPEGIRTIAFSSDGRTLAGADFDGAIQLWDTRARAAIGSPLIGHKGEVWGLAFSRDGRTLASSGFDGTVRLWDVAGHREALGPDIDARVGAVRSVAFSPDGRMVAFGGSDDTVRLWDVQRHSAVGPPLRGHRSSVWSVAFSPDGLNLASAGADQTVRLWDVRSGRQRGTLEGHEAKVVSLAFSPDGRTLASSDLAGEVRLWDVRTQDSLGEPLRGGSGEVWSVAFSPDGRTLASSGFDRTVRLWDVRTRKLRGEPLLGHTSGVIGVAFRSDGVLASSSYDGTVRLWDPERHTVLGQPLLRHTERVQAVAFSPNGRLLASAGFETQIRLWDTRAKKLVGQLGDDRTDAVESLAFSPDGRTLAAAEVDGTIGLWRMPGGKSVGELRGHEDGVESIAFSPDGSTLASASVDGTVRLWNLDTRGPLGEPLPRVEGEVLSVAFSPDGRTLAYGTDEPALHVWDVQSSTERRHDGADVIYSLAYSPDGETLASGNVGGEVWLWDVRRLAVRSALRGRSRVEAVSFSPDGQTLASASDDGTVRLWDTERFRSLGSPLQEHEGPVFSVAFSPDGRALASGGDDRTVRLWEGILWRDLADLEAQVCSLVVGNLTPFEWDELVAGLEYTTTCQS